MSKFEDNTENVLRKELGHKTGTGCPEGEKLH